MANRFRLVRAELGYSQREFAEKVGIPASQIQSIEDGRTARALDVKVRQIALKLGVDRDWLMWGGELVPDPEGPGGLKCPRQDSDLRQTRYKVTGPRRFGIRIDTERDAA